MKIEIQLNTLNEIVNCLQEAIDLTENTVSGLYSPDIYTTQPWREILNKFHSELETPRDA